MWMWNLVGFRGDGVKVVIERGRDTFHECNGMVWNGTCPLLKILFVVYLFTCTLERGLSAMGGRVKR